ncbi:MAG: hypothetical protein U0457_05360 [Candidatus Sericytochromatia bacterium]
MSAKHYYHITPYVQKYLKDIDGDYGDGDLDLLISEWSRASVHLNVHESGTNTDLFNLAQLILKQVILLEVFIQILLG